MKLRPILKRFSLLAVIIVVASCATEPPVQEVNAESDRAKAIVQGSSTPDFPATPAQPSAPQAAGSTQGTAPADTSPQSTATQIVQSQSGLPSSSQGQSPAGLSTGLSQEEQAFLADYLSRLSYMVYYNESSGLDPQLARIGVSQANRYLIEKQGLSVIDFDQIERNKKDQIAAYQAETGGSIDMIQYLAQKFNADIYIEIDAQVSGSGQAGAFSGAAQGTMKLFEASTAVLLGSVAFMSPPTFSPVSLDAAVSNALAASIWQSMPKVTEQSKALYGASLARGIRFELIAQKIPDAKQVAQLVRALGKKFKEAEQLSFSPGETRIALYGFMSKAKAQEAIYDAAASAMLPDMYLVYMRGKSFTFNSGL
ncbi:MAG: hypothetical protein RBT72_03680 [Spirochaetia bacterium]|nr:hypothetical protein [Spirochaetia bacterium]